MQSTNNATKKKQPGTVRLAMWSARHRWLVVAIWFGLVAIIFGMGTVVGTRTQSVNDSTSSDQLESQKAWNVFDAGGAPPPSDSLIVVVSRAGHNAAEPAYHDLLAKTTDNLKGLTYQNQPIFKDLTSPTTVLPIGLVSKDGSAARIIGTIPGDEKQVRPRLKVAQDTIKTLRDQNPDYKILTFSSTGISDDFDHVLSQDLRGSLYVTLPLSFLILLMAFGAVAAAFVPLILAISALLATFGLLAVYSQAVSPVDSSSTEVVVLIGLAVGIDYSLFLITRYRSERRRGRDKLSAIEVATSTAGRAVFFSGIIVMISLGGLFLVGEPIFTSIAVGTIGVVLAAVIGSLTFLPAVLAILGNGVNWGRIPYFGRDRAEDSGVWARLVRLVMRHPTVFALVSLVLLVSLALPVMHLRLGSNGLDGLPDSIEGVQAIRLMNEKWPEGTTLKLNVIVTQANRPETKAALDKFKADALQFKGLTQPVTVQYSTNGQVANMSFVMGGSGNDKANQDLVRTLRQQTVPADLKSVPGVEAYVTGRAAFTMDTVNQYISAMPVIFAFVLGLSFVLLLVAFRSLVIPIKAIILNLLSSGAAYGAMVLVFQDGWFSNQLGFRPTGVIESFAPIFMFTILFGLSMDYHLFILTRIKESKDHGLSSNEAVAKGIGVTSGTITSAAAIMVVVFAVFVTLQIMIVRQLGLGLAVAVFIDATIIRSILLPAAMRLLGDWNWWLPGFLNWLPQVTIEASDDDLEPLVLEPVPTLEEAEAGEQVA